MKSKRIAKSEVLHSFVQMLLLQNLNYQE